MPTRAIDARAERRTTFLAAASGVTSLVLGVAVYLLDRDWNSVLFLAAFTPSEPAGGGYFGPLGLNLPSFFHAYGFALLTILLLRGVRRGWLLGATGWFTIAAALEALQSEPARSLFLTTPFFPGSTPLGRAVEAYVVNGSFDTGDILAAAIGCLAAGAVAYLTEVPK